MDLSFKQIIENLGLIYIPLPDESIPLIHRLFTKGPSQERPTTGLEYFYFGVYHSNISKNYSLMKEYYLAAIELGESIAMYNLANYYKLIGDEPLMLFYYEKAVELGNELAMYKLGRYYDNKTDKSKEINHLAVRFYQMAIERNDVDAMHLLACYYGRTGYHFGLMKHYFGLAIRAGNPNSLVMMEEYYLSQAGSEEAFEFGLAHRSQRLIEKNYRAEYIHRLTLINSCYLTSSQVTIKSGYLTFLWTTLQEQPTYFSFPYCVKDVLEMIKAYL